MENPTMAESLILSLLGVSVVFVALSVLIVIIKLISKAAGALDGSGASVVNSAAAAPVRVEIVPAVKPGMIPAKGSLGDVALYDTDDKTAAMIMAIVADELKAPLNELRFVSIKPKAD
jgi:Na+-transporting methylmalonyl-CoA/oxaloacetate decarboxylase gamma subunit